MIWMILKPHSSFISILPNQPFRTNSRRLIFFFFISFFLFAFFMSAFFFTVWFPDHYSTSSSILHLQEVRGMHVVRRRFHSSHHVSYQQTLENNSHGIKERMSRLLTKPNIPTTPLYRSTRCVSVHCRRVFFCFTSPDRSKNHSLKRKNNTKHTLTLYL